MGGTLNEAQVQKGLHEETKCRMNYRKILLQLKKEKVYILA